MSTAVGSVCLQPVEPAQVPKVLVLLTTFNGARWLEDLLVSICGQEGVSIRIVASDDASADGTPALLEEWARRCNLRILDAFSCRLGSANRNFLRLIRDAPLEDETHIALADQDDVWLADKCLRAITELSRQGGEAYSSDVTAFWRDGTERYLRKSYEQCEFDYLFESAGPGCTYVFERAAFERLRRWITTNFEAFQAARVHDWLIYAYARASGWKWLVDRRSTLRYRQHGDNEIGANIGWRAALIRSRSALSGTYRKDVLWIACAVGDKSWVTEAMTRFDILDRLHLAFRANLLRRRPRDAVAVALLLLSMRRR